MHAFQSKILHRTLPLNKWLFKTNIKTSPSCDFCGIYTETIEHFLWECKYSKNIWLALTNWINSLSLNDTKINFNIKDTLLGNKKETSQIEHIKLITKYYLYTTKLKQETPNFTALMQQIKYNIMIEKLYRSNNFKNKWNKNMLNYFNL